MLPKQSTDVFMEVAVNCTKPVRTQKKKSSNLSEGGAVIRLFKYDACIEVFYLNRVKYNFITLKIHHCCPWVPFVVRNNY